MRDLIRDTFPLRPLSPPPGALIVAVVKLAETAGSPKAEFLARAPAGSIVPDDAKERLNRISDASPARHIGHT